MVLFLGKALQMLVTLNAHWNMVILGPEILNFFTALGASQGLLSPLRTEQVFKVEALKTWVYYVLSVRYHGEQCRVANRLQAWQDVTFLVLFLFFFMNGRWYSVGQVID